MADNVSEFEDLQEPEPRRRVLDQAFLLKPIWTLDPAPPVTVETGTSVAETLELMQDRHIGCILVTEEGRLAGIFTDRDVLREVIGARRDTRSVTVAEVMTTNPEVLSPSSAIVFALNKMSIGGFRHVPLVEEDGRPVGIVSVKDIVDYIVDFFPEVLNVPPEPGLDVSRSREGA